MANDTGIACLSDDAIASLVQGSLSPAELERARSHINQCAACRRLVAESATALLGESHPTPTGEELRPGSQVGRYVVLQRVGAGSMGVVYAAYDSELDRRIALKLLRTDIASRANGDDLKRRLQREAQAMARLNHPQVIAVYDVGTAGDQLFVAMEFVAGETLAAWLHAAPRSPAAILERFLRAGEGLAAAHAAGLVHRDFKPDNVLIADDGRLRVSDFGLACAVDSPSPPGSAASPRSATLAASLTATGSVIGTPAYMAPEQMTGGAVDARADVFSYCAALYEALYQQRPFAGADLDALRAAIAGDDVRPAPRGTAVPQWLRRVLTRGLRADPAARHASMRELLDELHRPQGRRWWRAVAAAAALLVAAGVVELVVAAQHARARLCHDGAGRLAAVWNAERRSQMNAAFAASRLPYAAETAATVGRLLDDHVNRWAVAHDDACAETRVRKQQSEQRMELRFACLDDRKKQLRALIDLFVVADPETVEHAAAGAASLTGVDACADGKALTDQIRPPRDAAQKARVEKLRVRTAELRALDGAGKFERALQLARDTLPEARAVGYAPVVADVLYLIGGFHSRAGDAGAARMALEESAALSLACGDDDGAAAAWAALTQVVGLMQGNLDEALRFARLASSILERMGGDEDVQRDLDDDQAQVLMRQGKLDEAERLARHALALGQKARDEVYTQHLAANLAIVLSAEGRLEEARALSARALEVQERILGAAHPDTVNARENLGAILVALRRFAEARPLLERGLRESQTIRGSKHPWTASALINLSEVDTGERRFAESTTLNRQALAILEPLLDKGDDTLCEPLTTLGLDALGSGHPVEALPPLERAVAIYDRQHATAAAAATRFALARALWETHRDPSRSRSLAVAARDSWNDAARRWGGVSGARAAEVDAWLKQL